MKKATLNKYQSKDDTKISKNTLKKVSKNVSDIIKNKETLKKRIIHNKMKKNIKSKNERTLKKKGNYKQSGGFRFEFTSKIDTLNQGITIMENNILLYLKGNKNNNSDYKLPIKLSEDQINNINYILQDVQDNYDMINTMKNFNIDKKFDRIVSIEMFEHMKNYRELFGRVSSWLKSDGLFFMHIFCHKNVPYEFIDKFSSIPKFIINIPSLLT